MLLKTKIPMELTAMGHHQINFENFGLVNKNYEMKHVLNKSFFKADQT